MNIDRIKEFESFITDDVAAAAKELDGLGDKQRKHLQRLVYTNLVDRFDSMVDHALLDNASAEPLLTEALEKLRDPLPEGELLRLLLTPSGAGSQIELRSQEILGNDVLRKRHSSKLRKLFEVFCPGENTTTLPRVNISTGKIGAKYKPRDNKIPTSICGYADWLYSRRNSVVHGGGSTRLLENDINKLKNLYNSSPAKTVKLTVGSISIASVFYQEVAVLLQTDH